MKGRLLQSVRFDMQLEHAFRPIETRPGIVVDVRGCRSDFLGLARANGTFRLVSTKRIVSGTTLFKIEGERTLRPTRYSVQIGDGLHVDLDCAHDEAEVFDRFFWRFMNHSCNPNARFCSEEVIAARDIEPFEDVTFDYNTTEYEMAEPFDCHCGSPSCLGRIQGFKHLTAEQRRQLHPRLAPYLSRLVQPGAKTDPT